MILKCFLNIQYLKTCCGSLQLKTMQNKQSNFNKCLFHVHILQKNKVCIIHKDTPFSENGKMFMVT